ncbi:MAG: hypothetical protein AB7F43_03460 [Bacteriovoracia bacterium]
MHSFFSVFFSLIVVLFSQPCFAKPSKITVDRLAHLDGSTRTLKDGIVSVTFNGKSFDFGIVEKRNGVGEYLTAHFERKDNGRLYLVEHFSKLGEELLVGELRDASNYIEVGTIDDNNEVILAKNIVLQVKRLSFFYRLNRRLNIPKTCLFVSAKDGLLPGYIKARKLNWSLEGEMLRFPVGSKERAKIAALWQIELTNQLSIDGFLLPFEASLLIDQYEFISDEIVDAILRKSRKRTLSNSDLSILFRATNRKGEVIEKAFEILDDLAWASDPQQMKAFLDDSIYRKRVCFAAAKLAQLKDLEITNRLNRYLEQVTELVPEHYSWQFLKQTFIDDLRRAIENCSARLM